MSFSYMGGTFGTGNQEHFTQSSGFLVTTLVQLLQLLHGKQQQERISCMQLFVLHSVTHLVTHSVIHLVTHSDIHLVTHSVTRLVTHSVTHLVTHSVSNSVTHSVMDVFLSSYLYNIALDRKIFSFLLSILNVAFLYLALLQW